MARAAAAVRINEVLEMNFLISVVLSTLETNTVFLIMLSLYRYKPDPKLPLMSGFGIALACMSYLLRNRYGLFALDTPLQLILMYFFIRYVYSLQWFYAGIMMISGTVIYLLLQGGVALLLHRIGLYAWSDTASGATAGAFLVQIISVLIAYTGVRLLRTINGGFTFISCHRRDDILINPHNRRLLRAMAATGFVLTLFFCAFVLRSAPLFYVSTPALLLSFAYFISLSLEKDVSDDR